MKILITALSIAACIIFAGCSGSGDGSRDDGQTTDGQTTDGQTIDGQTTDGQTTDALQDGDASLSPDAEFDKARELMANLTVDTGAFLVNSTINDDEYLKRAEATKLECIENLKKGLQHVDFSDTMYEETYFPAEEYVETLFKAVTDIAIGYRASQNGGGDDFETSVVKPALAEVTKDRFMVKMVQDKYAYMFPEYDYVFQLIGEQAIDMGAILALIG
jgi:hypothetical protein